METSILKTIRDASGIAKDDTGFDTELILFINGILLTLTQLGIGPDEGFKITGDTETWGDFIPEDPKLEAVKTYIYLKTKMMFDPPTNSNVTEAYNKQISEFEWRLRMNGEFGF